MAATLESIVPLDFAKNASFMAKIMSDLSGGVVSLLCTIGDRLGLFKELARGGPGTSGELGRRAGLNERYVREWLSALTAAGYLEYDPLSRRFTLPPEHAPILAQEGGPMFMGGVYQHLPGLFGPLDKLMEVFRRGGGIEPEVYGDDFREGMERISAVWFENLLVQKWIPAVEGLREKLEGGADVADLGCGSGRALIQMALAFPRSRFVGYELLGELIPKAIANTKAAGVSDRVRFEKIDVSQGLPGRYDLVTSFDLLHDISKPLAVLQGVRSALRPKGIYLLLEISCSDRLEENVGPVAAILYSTSVFFCTPTSLACGAEGLGTMGMPESKVRKLCKEAAFSEVDRLPFENPFNTLYVIKP
jgi:SAM-dependent methyltransferase